MKLTIDIGCMGIFPLHMLVPETNDFADGGRSIKVYSLAAREEIHAVEFCSNLQSYCLHHPEAL